MDPNSDLQYRAARPYQHDWPALPTEAKREAAIELIELALRAIETEHREPYALESMNLTSAIAAVRMHSHTAAFAFVQDAIELSSGERRRGLVGLHRRQPARMSDLRAQLDTLQVARPRHDPRTPSVA